MFRPAVHLLTALTLLGCPLLCPARWAFAPAGNLHSSPSPLDKGEVGEAGAGPAACCERCAPRGAPDRSGDPDDPPSAPSPSGCCFFDCICKGAVVESPEPVPEVAGWVSPPAPPAAVPAEDSEGGFIPARPPPRSGRLVRIEIASYLF
ncbi:MAG TPA: hypothetical protein VIL46_00260 [Gemmataceae bacterium]